MDINFFVADLKRLRSSLPHLQRLGLWNLNSEAVVESYSCLLVPFLKPSLPHSSEPQPVGSPR